MNRIPRTGIVLLVLAKAVLLSASAFAQNPFPRGNKAPNVHHVGDVWLHAVAGADSTFDYSVASVTMAPGARLNWHLHPEGQRLMFTDGVGYYQERGKPLQRMRAGAVVTCAPGVEHWHAASPDEHTVYLAISGDAPTQWREPVTEAEYNATPVEALAAELLQLSRDKWQWMADKDTTRLARLFHPQAQFVHMGGTWGTDRELAVIGSGGIHYKRADVEEANVEVLGDEQAVVYNRIKLLAVVGGNEVTNPFMVTEVYRRGEDGAWQLATLAFSRLLER